MRRPWPRVPGVAAVYAALSLLVVPVFPHFVSPNECARWLAAAALVERGSFEVSKEAAFLGDRFEDLSEKDGNLYPNKAPGAALVALPGYLLARPFVGPPSKESLRPTLYAMRLFGASLPALLLALSFAHEAGRLGLSKERARTVLFALLFATPLFAYGLLLYAHALVAACLFGAWALLFSPNRDGLPRGVPWRDVAAGALIGLAVFSEYPAAIPGLSLVLCAALRRDAGRLVRIVLGGLPFALALGAYNAALFGSSLALSSGFERSSEFQSLAKSGLFGVSWPSVEVLARLLGDPGKGLLVFSPFLVRAPAAFARAFRALPREAFLGLVLPPAAILLTYAGYPNWHGGWTVGARYLVSALPFLVFALAFLEGGSIESILLGASALAVWLTALTFPFVPEGFAFPWLSLGLPLLREGLVVPNGLHLGWGAGARVLPFVLATAAWLFAIPRTARSRPLAALSAFAAFALGAAAMLRLPMSVEAVASPSLPQRLRGAYIREVYFERRGSLKAELPPGVAPPARLLLRRDAELLLPPVSWPF